MLGGESGVGVGSNEISRTPSCESTVNAFPVDLKQRCIPGRKYKVIFWVVFAGLKYTDLPSSLLAVVVHWTKNGDVSGPAGVTLLLAPLSHK